MSEEAGSDLSGRWHGFYNMPNNEPPTPFEVELRDTGGLLSGTTSEEGDTLDCLGQTLHAILDGCHDGGNVSFTKHYDYLPRADYPVHYDGVLASDGNEIEGRWTIPSVWSGTFLMVRNAGQTEAAVQEVEVEVPVGR